ncbi:MAG: ATP-binding cassette domain-containing protein, partial [Verrucomicrobia bacterium]|nr:ATP-binding cassette domain-containing protein [Verrucomicrobiota bacterium]
ETRELRKSFGAQEVLRGVDLRIETGEAVVIIGRSGGGKSILLKHLIGLLSPDAGSVLVDGEDIAGLTERQLLRVRRRFGMLFQGAALFDSLNVEENVGFALRRERKWTEAEIGKKVDRVLEVVELSGTQKKMPAELSGGMKKRVVLARAIVYEPAFVLYDEPTTGLDPVVSDSIDRLIQRVNQHINVTSIVVTHDMRSAARVGERIIMLYEGRIHYSGTPKEIFDCADPIVNRFVNGISDTVVAEAPALMHGQRRKN